MLAAGAASATTFNFGNGFDNQSSVVLNSPDLTLTVSAYSDYVTGAGADTVGTINRNINGWGVSGAPDLGRLGASATETEALVLTFSRAVTLQSLSIFQPSTLGAFFSLLDSGDALLQRFAVPTGAPTPDVFNISYQGTTFVILGDSQGNGVRLAGLTVAAVPLPAASLLLASGLGLLGLFGRRRRKARA